MINSLDQGIESTFFSLKYNGFLTLNLFGPLFVLFSLAFYFTFISVVFTSLVAYFVNFLCRASPVPKNSEAVYLACRKRRLLGAYQMQSDC